MVEHTKGSNIYAICSALGKPKDPLRGIAFTVRKDNRNILYMNKHGSRKVLQKKLDIQHYNAVIEYVPEIHNIPADAFCRLIEKTETALHHIMVLGCRAAQRQLIGECNEWLCAYNGVDHTFAILTQFHPHDIAAEARPNRDTT